MRCTAIGMFTNVGPSHEWEVFGTGTGSSAEAAGHRGGSLVGLRMDQVIDILLGITWFSWGFMGMNG